MPRLRTKRSRLALAALLAVAAFGIAHGAMAQTDGPGTPGYTGPNLDIPVPGIEFSGIVRAEEITIPWLAQYIGGAYTFLISIAGLVASTMMIIGGFQYVTSAGDKGRIGAAKKRITDALIGLVLALGSYTILYAINPELVAFDGLKVTFVRNEPFDKSLGTTTIDTGAESAAVEAGSFTPTMASCPFTLTERQGTRAARLEFYAKAQASGVINGRTAAQRVVQAAELADICDVHLGSCGRTAGAISALAGVGRNTECLLEKHPGSDDRNNCNDGSKGRQLFALTSAQRLQMYAIRCDVEGGASWPQCSFAGAWQRSNSRCIRQDCVSSGVAARNKFRDFLKSESAAGRLPAGWPDVWANQLQPGDRLVIYNGNVDLVGAHAIIFMGWAKDGMRAQVVQGSAGQPTKGGTWCIKSACGDKLYPLIYAWRP